MNKLWAIVASIAGIAGLAMLWNSLLTQFDSWSVWQFGFVAQQVSVCSAVNDLDEDQCLALYGLYQANLNSPVLKSKFAQTPLTTLCGQNILCSNKKVTSLKLDDNQIGDISALAWLKSLKYLYLIYNQIGDISALAWLKSLIDLYLYSNQITDISALAWLTSLKDLYLNYNQIGDISALAWLESLINLGLSVNQIDDISALAWLTSLTDLGLSSNQIGDISALAWLKSLQHLYLHNNQICWPISPVITKIKGHLWRFSINNNYINRENEDTDVKDFAKMMDSKWKSQEPDKCEKYSWCGPLNGTWLYDRSPNKCSVLTDDQKSKLCPGGSSPTAWPIWNWWDNSQVRAWSCNDETGTVWKDHGYNFACAANCSYCWDWSTDEGFWETCDDGEENGTPWSSCTKSCTKKLPTNTIDGEDLISEPTATVDGGWLQWEWGGR